MASDDTTVVVHQLKLAVVHCTSRSPIEEVSCYRWQRVAVSAAISSCKHWQISPIAESVRQAALPIASTATTGSRKMQQIQYSGL